MPEGPSIVILKELAMPFKGKKVIATNGNAPIDFTRITNKTIVDFKSWGKHFLICFKEETLRVHFLLFGSYSINEQTKPDKSLRLSLQFSKGTIYFYTCAIKEIKEKLDEVYDWTADIMNEDWNAGKALKKVQAQSTEMVCDVLLDQDIFSGVGNIIKNEVLYRVKIHPASKVGKIPVAQLRQLIKETRNYSFDFLKWKKEDSLKKHWLAYGKKTCIRCNLPMIKQNIGKKKRSSYWCNSCQREFK